jgi:hypothetical protein
MLLLVECPNPVSRSGSLILRWEDYGKKRDEGCCFWEDGKTENANVFKHCILGPLIR